MFVYNPGSFVGLDRQDPRLQVRIGADPFLQGGEEAVGEGYE